MTKQSQQLVLVLIIGILIGTAAVMTWRTKEAGEAEDIFAGTQNSETVASGTLAAAQESVSHGATLLPLAPSIPKGSRVGLAVEDQSAGNVVAVNGLAVDSTAWVAVYDERGGQPGYILGAARVHKGDTSASVELLRPTTAGQKYFVAILGDDGSETFNRQSDLPPLSPEKVVIVSFVSL